MRGTIPYVRQTINTTLGPDGGTRKVRAISFPNAQPALALERLIVLSGQEAA